MNKYSELSLDQRRSLVSHSADCLAEIAVFTSRVQSRAMYASEAEFSNEYVEDYLIAMAYSVNKLKSSLRQAGVTP